MAFSLSFTTIIYIMQAVVITKAYRQTPKAKITEGHQNIIRLQAGQNYSLKCGVLNENNTLPFVASAKVSWSFKPLLCKSSPYCDFSSSTNDNSSNKDNTYADWKPINCDNNKPCTSPILQLANLQSEQDSGYYKCNIQPYCADCNQSKEIRFVMTYNVIVQNSSHTTPQILDGLSNKTATLGSSAIFHCCVHSHVQPTIKWFRKLTKTSPTSNRTISYHNEIFEPLESVGEKHIGENVYLSKLILTNIAFKDAGFYDCAAFNNHGLQKQEVYLSVIYSGNKIHQTTPRSEGIDNIVWLLMIPICLFTIIPIALRMCLFGNSKKTTNFKHKNSTEFQLKTVANENGVNPPYKIVNIEIV